MKSLMKKALSMILALAFIMGVSFASDDDVPGPICGTSPTSIHEIEPSVNH